MASIVLEQCTTNDVAVQPGEIGKPATITIKALKAMFSLSCASKVLSAHLRIQIILRDHCVT